MNSQPLPSVYVASRLEQSDSFEEHNPFLVEGNQQKECDI